MKERREKRRLRRGIGQYSWALLIYYLILNFAVMMVCEVDLIYRGFQAVIRSDDWTVFGSAIMDSAQEVYSSNGWGYLIACALVVALVPAWKGREFFSSLFETKRDMSGKSFLCLLCLFLSGQMVFQIVAIAEELLLNLFGLSVLESMDMASAGADTFSMFLYMAVGAPIVEEIVFRGVIMKGLQPYGKRFAIFASALLFGMFHGNLVQSPYAFVVGLILGYTAMEYSLQWAMVLHMINNLVIGDMLTRLTSFWPMAVGDLLIWGIILIGTIGAVVILIRKHRQIRSYRSFDPMDGRCLRAFFTSVPNIILAVITTVSAVSILVL